MPSNAPAGQNPSIGVAPPAGSGISGGVRDTSGSVGEEREVSPFAPTPAQAFEQMMSDGIFGSREEIPGGGVRITSGESQVLLSDGFGEPLPRQPLMYFDGFGEIQGGGRFDLFRTEEEVQALLPMLAEHDLEPNMIERAILFDAAHDRSLGEFAKRGFSSLAQVAKALAIDFPIEVGKAAFTDDTFSDVGRNIAEGGTQSLSRFFGEDLETYGLAIQSLINSDEGRDFDLFSQRLDLRQETTKRLQKESQLGDLVGSAADAVADILGGETEMTAVLREIGDNPGMFAPDEILPGSSMVGSFGGDPNILAVGGAIRAARPLATAFRGTAAGQATANFARGAAALPGKAVRGLVSAETKHPIIATSIGAAIGVATGGGALAGAVGGGLGLLPRTISIVKGIAAKVGASPTGSVLKNTVAATGGLQAKAVRGDLISKIASGARDVAAGGAIDAVTGILREPEDSLFIAEELGEGLAISVGEGASRFVSDSLTGKRQKRLQQKLIDNWAQRKPEQVAKVQQKLGETKEGKKAQMRFAVLDEVLRGSDPAARDINIDYLSEAEYSQRLQEQDPDLTPAQADMVAANTAGNNSVSADGTNEILINVDKADASTPFHETYHALSNLRNSKLPNLGDAMLEVLTGTHDANGAPRGDGLYNQSELGAFMSRYRAKLSPAHQVEFDALPVQKRSDLMRDELGAEYFADYASDKHLTQHRDVQPEFGISYAAKTLRGMQNVLGRMGFNFNNRGDVTNSEIFGDLKKSPAIKKIFDEYLDAKFALEERILSADAIPITSPLIIGERAGATPKTVTPETSLPPTSPVTLPTVPPAVPAPATFPAPDPGTGVPGGTSLPPSSPVTVPTVPPAVPRPEPVPTPPGTPPDPRFANWRLEPVISEGGEATYTPSLSVLNDSGIHVDVLEAVKGVLVDRDEHGNLRKMTKAARDAAEAKMGRAMGDLLVEVGIPSTDVIVQGGQKVKKIEIDRPLPEEVLDEIISYPGFDAATASMRQKFVDVMRAMATPGRPQLATYAKAVTGRSKKTTELGNFKMALTTPVFSPVAIYLSKTGYLNVSTFEHAHFEKRLEFTDAKTALDLWGGNRAAFRSDVLKVMQGHQKGLKAEDSLADESGPRVDKADRIFNWLGVDNFIVTRDAAGKEVKVKSKKGREDSLVRERRLSSIVQLTPIDTIEMPFKYDMSGETTDTGRSPIRREGVRFSPAAPAGGAAGGASPVVHRGSPLPPGSPNELGTRNPNLPSKEGSNDFGFFFSEDPEFADQFRTQGRTAADIEAQPGTLESATIEGNILQAREAVFGDQLIEVLEDAGVDTKQDAEDPALAREKAYQTIDRLQKPLREAMIEAGYDGLAFPDEDLRGGGASNPISVVAFEASQIKPAPESAPAN